MRRVKSGGAVGKGGDGIGVRERKGMEEVRKRRICSRGRWGWCIKGGKEDGVGGRERRRWSQSEGKGWRKLGKEGYGVVGRWRWCLKGGKEDGVGGRQEEMESN